MGLIHSLKLMCWSYKESLFCSLAWAGFHNIDWYPTQDRMSFCIILHFNSKMCLLCARNCAKPFDFAWMTSFILATIFRCTHYFYFHFADEKTGLVMLCKVTGDGWPWTQTQVDLWKITLFWLFPHTLFFFCGFVPWAFL